MNAAVIKPKKESIINVSFVLAMLILTIISTSNTMISQYRAVYVKTVLGGSATAAGIVGMWWTYGSMIVRIFVGKISTKVGSKKLVLVGSIFYGLTLASAALTTTVPQFTISILFQAVCHPFCYIAANSVLASSVPRGQEGLGTYLFVGLPTAISTSVAPIIANYCISNYNYGAMFFSAGLLMVFSAVLAIVLILFARKNRSAAIAEDIRDKATQNEADKTALDENGRPYKGIWGFFERKALGPCLLQILGNLAELAVLFYITMYAAEMGVPQNAVAFFSVVAVVQLICTLGLGTIMDRFGLLAVMIPAVVGGIAAYLVLLTGGLSYTAWIVAAIGYGISSGCLRPTFNAGMLKIVPRNRLSVATSNFALATSIGGGITNVVVGALIDAGGYRTVWIFCITMYVVLFVASVIVFRKLLGRNHNQQPV